MIKDEWFRHNAYKLLENNPAMILLLIRDGRAYTEHELLKIMGLGYLPSGLMYRLAALTKSILGEFIESGLVVEQDGVYAATPLVAKIQSALAISLTELTQRQSDAMTVAPLFGIPDGSLPGSDIFVVMPFTNDLLPVYVDHILRVAGKLGLSVARADDFYTTHEIVYDVWHGIAASKLVIADCTGRNPNVFYEIGIAHTIGKPVILITQNLDDIPFDLRHRRVIEYKYTPPGMKKFEQLLRHTIDFALGE
jgi:hypothetical protein